jgi:hypothetical protein
MSHNFSHRCEKGRLERSEHPENGSGSLEQDGPVLIVAMKKEEQTRLVHHYRL